MIRRKTSVSHFKKNLKFPPSLNKILEKDRPQISKTILPVSLKWKILGTQLGIPKPRLDSIEHDYSKLHYRINEMIYAWFWDIEAIAMRLLLLLRISNVIQLQRSWNNWQLNS